MPNFGKISWFLVFLISGIRCTVFDCVITNSFDFWRCEKETFWGNFQILCMLLLFESWMKLVFASHVKDQDLPFLGPLATHWPMLLFLLESLQAERPQNGISNATDSSFERYNFYILRIKMTSLTFFCILDFQSPLLFNYMTSILLK